MTESQEMPVVDRFVSYKTSPASWPGEPGAVIRRDGEGEVEMVNLAWGLEPQQPGARPFTFLRSEGRRFGARRCLIPSSEFTVSNGQGKDRRKWRVTMPAAEFFYLGGIWRPATGGWPASYAILTIAANPDIEPYQERQGAVIRRADRINWLDHLEPQENLLKPLPKGTFYLEQIEGPKVQPAFHF